jgi:hypothetical protein
MPVTIKVNGVANSLVHKGSNGISVATIPDVCKTPSPGGPVPVPYPNVSQSATLAKGTTTVKADGGMMIAIKGSEFSLSNGDNAGVAGGVKSSTFMKESTWILYSFDVKMDGANACRLTDKKFQNHQNTVDLGGIQQAPVNVRAELRVICEIICRCDAEPSPSASGDSELKQYCVTLALRALDNATFDKSTMKPEISYDMTQRPPSPLMHRGGNGLAPSEHWQQRAREIPGYRPGTGMVRRPDVVIVADPSKPPVQGNLKGVVEIKFPPDRRDPAQIADYEAIAGGDPNRVVELSPEECGCAQKKRQPAPVPSPSTQQVVLGVALLLAAAALVLSPVPGDEVAAGAAGLALLGL